MNKALRVYHYPALSGPEMINRHIAPMDNSRAQAQHPGMPLGGTAQDSWFGKVQIPGKVAGFMFNTKHRILIYLYIYIYINILRSLGS